MEREKILAKLNGVAEHFSGNGRKLGYPTANINATANLKDGVYFGYASLGKFNQNPALIFIGTPTTVGDKDRRVEANLLDIPDKDYYDLPLTLTICYFHRANKTFENLDELMAAMQGDEAAGRKWFSENSAPESSV